METGKASKSTNFNIALSKQYHLAIEISKFHIKYCIIDSISSNNLLFEETTINSISDITSVLNNNEYIKADFKSSTIAFSGYPYTLIPSKIYSEKSAKNILEFNCNIFDKINTDTISKIGTNLVYSIPEEIAEILDGYFPTAKKYHQITILLSQFFKKEKFSTTTYLYIDKKKIHICIFETKKLIFTNSFDFFNKEDILYYTLFVLEQLKLDTNNITVELYGDINTYDENYQLLHEYIRNITIGENHQHFSLENQFLCE